MSLILTSAHIFSLESMFEPVTNYTKVEATKFFSFPARVLKHSLVAFH